MPGTLIKSGSQEIIDQLETTLEVSKSYNESKEMIKKTKSGMQQY